jgi:hypothetical protein
MRKADVVSALVVSVALAGSLAYYQEVIRPTIQFNEERRAIERILRQWWEGRPPPGVTKKEWEGTWIVAYNGLGNVCYTPSCVSLQEMRRLKADVAAKARRPATVASLRWFWQRLAETGPHGKQYIKRMTPLLDEAIGQLPAPGP